MKDLLFNISCYSQLRVLRTWLTVDQSSLTFRLIIPFPFVICFSGDTKEPACLGDIPVLLYVIKNFKLTANIALSFRGHAHKSGFN